MHWEFLGNILCVTKPEFKKLAIDRNIPVEEINEVYIDYIQKRRALKATKYIIEDDELPAGRVIPKSAKLQDFNLYRQILKCGLFRLAAGPNHYQMDLFYVKRQPGASQFQISYLAIIGVNNRFAVVEPTNTFVSPGMLDVSPDFTAVADVQKDINAVEITLDKCLKKLSLFHKHIGCLEITQCSFFSARTFFWIFCKREIFIIFLWTIFFDY
jgi:hypothetical protein